MKAETSRQERLMGVLHKPIVSEKGTLIGEKHNQYLFDVRTDANKIDIKAAIEMMFKVQVASVRVANVKGKSKRAGRFMGRRVNWKKAYVSLKPGQEIDFTKAA